jgi:hypothetical protein
VALPFTLKSIIFWQKKKNYGNSNNIFTMQKLYNNLPKNPLKKTKNPSRYYNSVANIKFQHKPKYHLQKPSYKNKHIT